MGIANQRGNIFTVLFGAVAVVGIITVATMQLISGPIRTATRVNALNMANSSMQAAGRILILDAANQANSGDVDSDGTIEPREFTTVASGGIVGGGSIPLTVGASRTDPWGTLFGYCVWNDGTSYGALTNILAGAIVTGSPIPTVIAVVSAGPNKVFETSCVAYAGGVTTGDAATTGVVKVSGSDDIVMKWTYAEALAASGGLWAIKAGAPATATIGKNLEISDPNNANTVTAKIDRTTGIGDFLGVTTDLITAKTNNDIQVVGNVGFGQATPVAPIEVLNSWNSVSAPTAVQYGVRSVVNIAGTGMGGTAVNPAGRMVGGLFVVDNNYSDHTNSRLDAAWGNATNSGTATVLTGGNFVGTNNAGATATNIYGTSGVAANYSTNAVTNMYGGYSLAQNVGAGPVTTMYGAQNYSYNTAAGTVGSVIGAYNYGRNNATGSVTSNLMGSHNFAYSPGTTNAMYGGYNYAWNDTTGTNTNMYGIYSLGANTGTSTNLYGGYISSSNSGTLSGPMYGAYNYAVNTATATNLYGGFDFSLNTGTASTVYGNYALGRTAHSTGNVDTAYGVQALAQNTAAGTVTTAYGVYAEASNNASTGTITTGTGLRASVVSGSGSTITTGMGVQIDMTNSGTIGTYYGLKIEDEGTGNANHYSIYTGTTKSYFGGKIGVGTGKTAPTYDIDASGDIRANSFIMSSDLRLKKDVATLDNALELVTKLRGVHFNWKEPINDDQKGVQTGVIAQEVEKVYPELVSTDNKGFKAVNYPALIAPIIEAVKELKDMIEDILAKLNPLADKVLKLEMENKALYRHIDGLEKRLDALEAKNAS